MLEIPIYGNERERVSDCILKCVAVTVKLCLTTERMCYVVGA